METGIPKYKQNRRHHQASAQRKKKLHQKTCRVTPGGDLLHNPSLQVIMIPSSPPAVTTCQSADADIRDRCAMADDDTVFTMLSQGERSYDRSLCTCLFFRSYLLLVKWRVLRGILPGFYTLIYILGALARANGRTGRPPADTHTQPKYPPHTRVHPVAVDSPKGPPEFIHDSSWLQGPILDSVRSSCGWSSFTIRFVGATFRKWKYINRLVF